jgi:hypothetical protein
MKWKTECSNSQISYYLEGYMLCIFWRALDNVLEKLKRFAVGLDWCLLHHKLASLPLKPQQHNLRRNQKI